MLVVGFGVLKLSFEKMFYNKHDVLVRLNRKAAPVFSQLQNMLNKWFWRDCEIHWHYDDFNEGLTKAPGLLDASQHYFSIRKLVRSGMLETLADSASEAPLEILMRNANRRCISHTESLRRINSSMGIEGKVLSTPHLNVVKKVNEQFSNYLFVLQAMMSVGPGVYKDDFDRVIEVNQLELYRCLFSALFTIYSMLSLNGLGVRLSFLLNSQCIPGCAKYAALSYRDEMVICSAIACILRSWSSESSAEQLRIIFEERVPHAVNLFDSIVDLELGEANLIFENEKEIDLLADAISAISTSRINALKLPGYPQFENAPMPDFFKKNVAIDLLV